MIDTQRHKENRTMCYPLPGPRCSAHTKAALDKARKAYAKDKTNFELYGKLKEAQAEYELTPAGIAELREAGKHEEADRNEHARKTMLTQTTQATTQHISTLENQDKLWLTENPTTPTETLVKLAGDEDYQTRETVTQHPNTPATVLETLSQDQSKAVRYRAIHNPNLPTPALTRLTKDKDYEVREAAKWQLKETKKQPTP